MDAMYLPCEIRSSCCVGRALAESVSSKSAAIVVIEAPKSAISFFKLTYLN